MRRYEGTGIRIAAFKRGGYHVLRISNYKVYFVATKGSRKAHTEEGWMPEYEKKFEDKAAANNYFKGIKRNYPDLKMIADEPNKYINHEGKIKEY